MKSPQYEQSTSTTPSSSRTSTNSPGNTADQCTPSIQTIAVVQDDQSPQNTEKESSTTISPQYESGMQEESPRKIVKYNIHEIMKKPKIKLQDCTVQERQPEDNLRQPQPNIRQPQVSNQQKPTKIVVLKPPTQQDQPSNKKLLTKKRKIETTLSSKHNIRRYLSCTNISRSSITSVNIQCQYSEDNTNISLQTHVPDSIRVDRVHSSLQISRAPVSHSDESNFSQSDDSNSSQSEASNSNDIFPCKELSIGANDQMNSESELHQNRKSCNSCGLSLKREGSSPSEYVCFCSCQIDLIK